MTPEEKAVIDAAIYLKYCIDAGTAGDPPRIGRLLDAIDALIFACPQCNAGGHTCPGDGKFISHTATDCGVHEDPRQSIVDASTYPCWECLVDPTEDPRPWCDCRPEDSAEPAHPYPCRLRAHMPENCLNRPSIAECDNCASLVASVTRVDGTEEGEPARDCMHGPRQEPTVPPRPTEAEYGSLPILDIEVIKTGPNTETHILSRPEAADITSFSPMSVENPETDPPDLEPTWEPATLLYCLAGDRIRIGQDETDVLRSSSGAWHAQIVSSVLPSGKTWDKVTPWEHTELRLDLSANPGFQEYPPNLPCEILCTPERLAILHLMQGIPGTTVIKR